MKLYTSGMAHEPDGAVDDVLSTVFSRRCLTLIRYGKHRICAATGLYLKDCEKNSRDEPCWRKATLLNG